MSRIAVGDMHGNLATLDDLLARIRDEAAAEPMMEIHQEPEVITSIIVTARPGGINSTSPGPRRPA
jgi:hypothetical protein